MKRVQPYRAVRWTGTALQVVGAILLALNLLWSGWAFVPMLAGALTWTTIAALSGDGALAAMNAVFAAINCIGIWRWLL